jgi:hypothetical protein
MAAKLCTLLLAAVVVLSLLVSPIACSRKLSKTKPKTKPAARVIHKPAAAPAVKASHKPATPAKSHTNHTTLYGSGGWLSGAGATYYGAPNGDGGEGQ